MTTVTTLVLDFSSRSSDCSGLKIEQPGGEFSAGDQVELRLWGPLSELTGWELLQETTSLGTGTRKVSTDLNVEEDVEFAISAEPQNNADLEWPVDTLVSVVPKTRLLKMDDNNRPVVWARREVEALSKFARRGHCGIKTKDKTAIYGTVRVSYRRLKNYLSWYWTIPAGYAGNIWFFLYKDGELHHVFAIEVPTLASEVVEYKNIIIEMIDHSSEAPLEGVEIIWDGLSVGYTDADGTLYLDQVRTGTHTFKGILAGYLDTDKDSLSNEEVTV